MITAIVIPVDPDEPLRLEQLAEHDVAAYNRLVDGDLQLVGLDRPRAVVYFNEEGKARQMPANPRATALLWVHNSAFLGQDVLAGPAFIVGPPDRGNDTSVPESLVYLLFHATRYEVQVLARGERRWSGNELVFTDWFDAYRYAVKLAYRWTSVEEIRVVPKLNDELREAWYRLGTDQRLIAAADDPPFRKESFVGCYSIDELAERISAAPPIAGTTFYYCDLCFIRQVNADDGWLVIHGTKVAFDGLALKPMIKEGMFASLVQQLLATPTGSGQ